MHIIPDLPQPLRLASIFFRRFLPWYFLEQPIVLLRIYLAYAAAFLQVFSFVFLLKTLLSPWKGIADTYPDNKLQLVRVFQVFTLNCTARVVGAVVRIGAILIGIAVQILLLASFVLVLLAWIAFPPFLVFALRFLFQIVLAI